MSDLHFRTDGRLDMRYASSKAALAKGLCDSNGNLISSPSNFSSPTAYSDTHSTSYSNQASDDLHFCADGRLDMRYVSSKAAYVKGLCDINGNMYSLSSSTMNETKPVKVKSETKSDVGQKSPKEITRTDAGRTKYGSKEDGTNAGHIMSFRVINAILSTTPGRPMSNENKEQIVRALNVDENLYIKTRSGNMYGKDGYSGDEYYDQQIEEVIKGDKNRLTNQRCVDRLERQWEFVRKSDLPTNVKEMIRSSFSKVRDQNGNVIIRSNASLY